MIKLGKYELKRSHYSDKQVSDFVFNSASDYIIHHRNDTSFFSRYTLSIIVKNKSNKIVECYDENIDWIHLSIHAQKAIKLGLITGYVGSCKDKQGVECIKIDKISFQYMWLNWILHNKVKSIEIDGWKE